jgi:predicted CXXCH cytochrome family protein
LKRWRWLAGICLALAAVAVALLSNSCSTMPGTVMVPPAVEGASFVGDKICFDCHSNVSRVFPSSPHARLHLEVSGMAGQQGCEACHGPASKHVAFGGGKGKFIVNPGKDPSACLQCHLETQAEFRMPQHHPVLEGKMNCVQCHDPHGLDIMKPAGGLTMSRLNESCATCHREETRPFVFEHVAMREGCVVCHNPHGSINARMLVQRDNNLCLKCHAQIAQPGSAGTGRIFIGKEDHTTYLPLGTCWSAGCHEAVHGSSINSHMRY